MKESTLQSINTNISGILILSHGGLALEMLGSATMICGEIENVVALGVYPGDDIDLYRARVEELMGLFPAGVFVMVDMMSGTPFNTLLSLGEQRTLHGIAGMNLALLLDVNYLRYENSLEEISQMAEEKIHTSICDIGKFQRELQES